MPPLPGFPFAAASHMVADDSLRAPMISPPSPCTKVCTVDPVSGLCLGCGRSLAEIERWLAFTEAERTRIMAQLPARIAALTARRTHPG